MIEKLLRNEKILEERINYFVEESNEAWEEVRDLRKAYCEELEELFKMVLNGDGTSLHIHNILQEIKVMVLEHGGYFPELKDLDDGEDLERIDIYV